MGPVAPEIDWDYAVIETDGSGDAENSSASLRSGQAGAAARFVAGPGAGTRRRCFVFSQGDIRVPIMQQTKFVRLEGEFVHAGVYTTQPGETLRDLVERAGGFTASAYLFGSEFTRESTRAIQQRRMDEYVEELEMQMQRGNLALASSAVAGPAGPGECDRCAIQRTGVAGTSASDAGDWADRSGIQGRQQRDRSVLPDIALEDGDRFVVPPVPSQCERSGGGIRPEFVPV